jgi:hypothetical protein
VNAWQQQRLDDLRRALAAALARRAELADVDAVRRLDAEIADHCRTIADVERALREAT